MGTPSTWGVAAACFALSTAAFAANGSIAGNMPRDARLAAERAQARKASTAACAATDATCRPLAARAKRKT